jgi:hypothetical protein
MSPVGPDRVSVVCVLIAAHRYSNYFVSQLKQHIPIPHLARVLTFLETDLSTVAVTSTMTCQLKGSSEKARHC